LETGRDDILPARKGDILLQCLFALMWYVIRSDTGDWYTPYNLSKGSGRYFVSRGDVE
jgi:hypothetical protein